MPSAEGIFCSRIELLILRNIGRLLPLYFLKTRFFTFHYASINIIQFEKGQVPNPSYIYIPQCFY